MRDESISLSPPSKKSPMDGGVVAGMSSLSSKQHLQGLKQNKHLEQTVSNLGYLCLMHAFVLTNEHVLVPVIPV